MRRHNSIAVSLVINGDETKGRIRLRGKNAHIDEERQRINAYRLYKNEMRLFTAWVEYSELLNVPAHCRWMWQRPTA